MKKALCLKDINDFNLLSDGKIETIAFQFVDRAICEVPGNGFFQLIPYVSFSFLDVPEGKLNCIVYRRPSSGEGESRLEGNSSMGFGGHIDDVSDLTFSKREELEDGTVVYHMTLEDIKNTCMTCASRELTEEVGFDAFKDLDVPTEHITFSLEREQEPDEVGQVHVCISIRVNLDQSRFTAFFEKAKAQETEVEGLNSISIDVGRFLSSFEVTTAMKEMSDQLDKELKMEKWSVLVVHSLLTHIVGFLQANWDFRSIMDIMIERIAEKASAEKQAHEASNQEVMHLEVDQQPSSNVIPLHG